MKVLLLSSTDDPTNGYGNITKELVSYLDGRVDFRLLLPKDESGDRYRSYSAERVLPPYIFNLKTPKVFEYLKFDWPASDCDVIHSIFEFPYALIAARLAKRYNKPLIIGTQGTYAIQPLFWKPEKWFIKWAYNFAKTITAPSNFTRDNIIKYSKTKSPVKIIHNAVNFERFQKPTDTTLIRNRYPGRKLLLTAGGLKPRKGHDVVIRALGILARKRDDFQYLIIGAGKLKEHLQNLVTVEGIAKRVTFCGQIDGDELVRYFQACDLYVHTPILTNWQFEGFGIVYLEASACAKPIVAADSGGIRDAVLDGRTGLIVPEGDTIATAGAIEHILDNPELAERFGNQGREYARQNTWDIVGQSFIRLYEEISAKK